jgi:hypothetical protein
MALQPDQIENMITPLWEQAKAAIDAGDTVGAKRLIDAAVDRSRSLQDYSINWVTSLLSFIGRELGEEAVERALRRSGDDFIRARRASARPWDSLPAETRARAVASAMVANFGTCEIDEDAEKFILSFQCGSGGRLIDEGKYGPDGYLVLHQRAGRTFMRDELPVYCAHCSVNNEIQPIEWGAAPVTVEHPPTRPGERCVHHIYKDSDRLPPEVYVRIGMDPPDGST